MKTDITKILRIVGDEYIANNDEYVEDFPELDKFCDDIKSKVGKKEYEDLYDELMYFLCKYESHVFAKGMELTLKIMEGDYVPVI